MKGMIPSWTALENRGKLYFGECALCAGKGLLHEKLCHDCIDKKGMAYCKLCRAYYVDRVRSCYHLSRKQSVEDTEKLLRQTESALRDLHYQYR
ncbi:TPA: hypothetical protein DD449_03300 [Candidatus Berkelbacteria bacterium]|uniref:Uncharacterized protein n=1 Tax=Berkelbacteria bacterium GW2011_GWE1_39_12 TaxID=1618337 RepID=A0A0G4B2K1_9BACT|nr:MAG: hypothetical protein UT28_C0001G0289 [Berkelbacteria bacterium GW2011_GWE1_39_12]HBO60684.1 hypothetical protein [Candidatus Berkelbacteria bacterium]